jgi:hypothetical protein
MWLALQVEGEREPPTSQNDLLGVNVGGTRLNGGGRGGGDAGSGGGGGGGVGSARA